VELLGRQGSGGENIKGVITNISESGCQLACQETFNVDDQLFLRITFPTGTRVEKISCILKSVNDEAGKFNYGVMFDIIDDDELIPIKEFINAVSEYFGSWIIMEQNSEVMIPIGDVCQVQYGDEKMFSTFRGCRKPDYALIDMPTAGGKPVYIHFNSNFMIRFLASGSVYGFETRIVNTHTKPITICVIEYPTEIKAVNLRKSKRITTHLPATIETKQGLLKGAIIDLSEGGGLFSTLPSESVVIPKGEECLLSATLPSGEKVDKLRTQLCSVKEREGKTMIGLRFDRNGNGAYSILKSYYDICSF
jgi:c-di-GMP-binding flagellar brake protein YcgR